ncbi:MAG: hypothetical protein G01um101425_713 [Candidatus Peregrinibacteria bacterium Gr01-1014_25]|nr:MAG: hypothetical protein G01um101425_713 [Candidatus Peregrinibacteria bacterium Gr01-1014_25]
MSHLIEKLQRQQETIDDNDVSDMFLVDAHNRIHNLKRDELLAVSKGIEQQRGKAEVTDNAKEKLRILQQTVDARIKADADFHMDTADILATPNRVLKATGRGLASETYTGGMLRGAVILGALAAFFGPMRRAIAYPFRKLTGWMRGRNATPTIPPPPAATPPHP